MKTVRSKQKRVVNVALIINKILNIWKSFSHQSNDSNEKTGCSRCCIGTISSKAEKKLNQKRLGVRNWIRLRDIEQSAQKLICDLRNEGSNTFKQFFRLSSEQFDFLLDLIRPMISKKDTQMRKAISADTRLALTLRYLSSGDSYRSLIVKN